MKEGIAKSSFDTVDQFIRGAINRGKEPLLTESVSTSLRGWRSSRSRLERDPSHELEKNLKVRQGKDWKNTVETPSEALKPSGMLENWINIAWYNNSAIKNF